MIRYKVSKIGTTGTDLAELEGHVKKKKKNWLKRAKKRTDKLAKARSYNESSGI